MKQKLLDKFAELFGNSEGAHFYFSPGRVNLIGEHTDYNGGHVFPCALTMGTYGVARKRDDRMIHFYSMNLDTFGVVEASLDDLTNKKEYNWANYPLGVVWAFAEKGYKLDTGFDMVIWGNIPNGSGLSSSASLEVLTGVILTDLYGVRNHRSDHDRPCADRTVFRKQFQRLQLRYHGSVRRCHGQKRQRNLP